MIEWARSQPNLTKRIGMYKIVKQYFDRVRSFNIGVFFKVGSYLENKRINGITHLIEHMVFKRTINRTSFEISKEIERVGGSIDAFTSKEIVGFYVRVDKDFKDIALNILSDVVLNPVFDSDDLDREKQVVYEELKMREDNPLSLAFENFEKIIFEPSSYSFEIGGDPEIIGNISREDILNFYRGHFVQQNAIISIAGNYDESSIDNDIKKYFDFKAGKEDFYPSNIVAGTQKDHILIKDVQQANFVIGFRSVSMRDKMYYPLYILMNAIAGGMSSILFQKLREEEGLVYAIGNASDHYYPGGYEAVYASCSPSKYLRSVEKILNVFKDIKQGKIEKEYIIDSKSNIVGAFSLSLESPLRYLSKNVRDILFYQRIRTIDEIIDNIKNSVVDFSYLQDIIKPENIYVSTVGPRDIEKHHYKVREMINEILG